MSHLLVTNDFPPKVGGIQTYLWELWKRLPEGQASVLTTDFAGAAAWDDAQPFEVRRVDNRVLLPRRTTVDAINTAVAATGAKLAVLDPALPLGMVGPRLDVPYAVVLHGAEVTVPRRLPVSRERLASVLRGAAGIIAAGGYPAAEARHAAGGAALPEIVEVPPGVNLERFHPLAPEAKRRVRKRLSLPVEGDLIVYAGRLVPRKGVDVLIEATTRLVPHRPDLTVAVVGRGRDATRLSILARRMGVGKRVRFLGRLTDVDLADLYGAADLFVTLCRDRWRGLEQEGFGIVFLEAAASGVPQIAGRSGGSAEAVEHGVTGLVVDDPTDIDAAATAIATILDDPQLRARMGLASRERAEAAFGWDRLAARSSDALARWEP